MNLKSIAFKVLSPSFPPSLSRSIPPSEPLVLPELVTYDDPQGKFTLKVPKGWFTKR